MQWKYYLWQWALNRYEGLVAPCLVFRPETLFLHIRKEDAFISFLINVITSFSDNPNWYSIASKDVRSSHAISIMRSVEADCKSLIQMVMTFSEKDIFKREWAQIPQAQEISQQAILLIWSHHVGLKALDGSSTNRYDLGALKAMTCWWIGY